MILLVDNFDSFTYNLADCVLQTGVACTIVRNTLDVNALDLSDCQGILLSPGPGTPRQAGNLMPLIARYHDTIPMLGYAYAWGIRGWANFSGQR